MRDNTHKITNPQLQADLSRLCVGWADGFDDPIAQAQAVGWLMDFLLTELSPALSAVRVRAIRQLRVQGFTLAEIGAELGLTRARVEKIANT